jgi:RimJ/RimL family protein N-acetyltransferase
MIMPYQSSRALSRLAADHTNARAMPISKPDIDTTFLQDDRLLLRPWRLADAPAMAEAVRESVDSFQPWLNWCSADYGPEDALAHIRACATRWVDGQQFAFAVYDRHDGTLVGSAGLNQFNRIHRSANAGYWTRRSRQGQRLAARALTMIARFGFDELGLVRVEIVAEPGNQPSRRTAERAGARFEAIARHRLWLHDQPADAAVYGLLPGDLAED